MALRRSRGRSSSSDNVEEEPSEWLPSKLIRNLTKGVRKVEEFKWTRVMKFDKLMDDLPTTYSIEKDLKKHAEETKREQFDLEEQDYQMTDFDITNQEELNLDLSAEVISVQDLRLFAEKLIIVRKSILENARFIQEEESVGDGPNFDFPANRPTNLQRKFQNKGKKRKKSPPKNLLELSMDRRYLKRRKLCNLSCNDKIDIMHMVKVQQMSQREAAGLYQVKSGLVAYLIKKSKDDNQHLPRLVKEEEEKMKIKEEITMVASSMYKSEEGIKRAIDVIQEVWQRKGILVTMKQVIPVMKEVLNLHYRPIKRIPFQANSVRCLIQRQRYAKVMIDLLLRGQVVINLDESWINLKDYSRFCWRERGASNSSNVQTISPRISLIVAMDSNGEVYFSLTQVNTDKFVKSLFLKELCSRLDQDRQGWRQNTVFLMDNASYNRNDVIIEQIQKLEIKVMFTAPYSWDASPIERYFGYLKQGKVMEPFLPSGKLQVQIIDSIKQFFFQCGIGSHKKVAGDDEERQRHVLAQNLFCSL